MHDTTTDELPVDSEKDTIAYLALGDSYTIGSGESEQNRWPNLLAGTFTKSGYNFHKPRIIARSGWTTGNLIRAIDEEEFNRQYDMVSLLIGVNNQYQGMAMQVFEKEFLALLEFCMKTAKSRSGIFVLSIPDYGATPFGQSNEILIAKEINEYNDFIKKVCADNKIKFYDITDISRKAKGNLSYLAADQLHPSKKMYEEWVQLIYC
jgi:acyl-CoA thioesterase I